jgi:nitroreductase
MPNEVFEAVRTVLAVREFDNRPLGDDVIHRIAEAGHLTASGGNQQPWHFVVIRERANLENLGSLVRTGRYTSNAAAAFIVAYEKDSRSALSDASRAIQSMILTAWAEGVASNWTGFGGLVEVAREFGIPDTLDVLAVVPFGYPKRRVIGKKKRKPFGQIVSAERFGAPLT